MSEFPVQAFPDSTNYGMTLRDYFAAKAMAVLLDAELPVNIAHSNNLTADAAYKMADAMMEKRK